MRTQLVAVFLALQCAAPVIAQNTALIPTAGRYSGTAKDSSTFQLVLVHANGKPQVQETGYRFIPTGMTVNRVVMKSGEAFGKVDGGKLTFQIPVLLKFTFSANINRAGGSTTMAWYQGAFSWNKPNEIACTLTEVKTPAKEYENKFSIEDISFGPAPEGKAMQKFYHFVLKPATN
jgi:hypothetical protein